MENNNFGQVKISNDVVATIAGLAALEVEGVETNTTFTDKILKNNGVKIQIEQVEATLKKHFHTPFMITSAPDAKFGEIVVLLIENNPGSRDTYERIQKICEDVLPAYWCPKRIIPVENLPLTETGKPDRATAKLLAQT